MFFIGGYQVYCFGYGVMQFVGLGVFGLFKNCDVVFVVLCEVVVLGVNYIDMSDFYGFYIMNQLICEVLYLYCDDLFIVIKIGVRCDV